jgi:hypothetical protein
VQEPPAGNPFLLDLIQKTINSGIQQARFRPGELKNMGDKSIFNRYLIAPNRDPVPGAKIQSIIASASVGAFGGFLSRAFRVHDFQLGRLNCQGFLQSIFALPYDEANNKKNPLFDTGWTESARQRFRIVEGPDGQDRPPGTEPGPGDNVFLPIIPLMGTATQPVKLLDWPSYSQGELDALRVQVETRLGAVVKRLIDLNVSYLLNRAGLEAAFRLFRGHLADKILQNIADDLRDRKLLQ